MKLRERTVLNYNVDSGLAKRQQPVKPTPSITHQANNKRKTLVKVLQEQPTALTSALKIRLRREVIQMNDPVSGATTSEMMFKSTTPTPAPKKTTVTMPHTTNKEMKEVAAILASFIIESEQVALANLERSALEYEREEKEQATNEAAKALLSTEVPALLGLPDLSGLPQAVSDSAAHLAVTLPYPIPPSPVSCNSENDDLICHSPPYSPCAESSPSGSTPSSPCDSRPSSPLAFMSKDDVPIEKPLSPTSHTKTNKRKRTRTTQSQLNVLEKIFDEDKTPCKARRDEIGAQLSMSSRSVQVWFQNRRSKMKKGSSTVVSPASVQVKVERTSPTKPVVKTETPVLPRTSTAVQHHAPPALPTFSPVISHMPHAPLPLPQIHSIDQVALQRPASATNTAVIRTKSHTRFLKERTPIPELPLPSNISLPIPQQVFILPKLVPVPIAPAAVPVNLASLHTTVSSSTTTTIPPLLASTKSIHYQSPVSTPKKASSSKQPLSKRRRTGTHSSGVPATLVPIQPAPPVAKPIGSMHSTIVSPVPVVAHTVVAPRPIKIAMQPHTEFSRATLVPVEAKN
eukprot:TRINITY_DN2320_c0_g1_i2.p1 TRINITY_DN2320_c0_g1~~TRINITY_DN2320_c0_g1_i2.p1  ORF type:complete len:572 (-),score=94.70 TRINITY_DN2320_c0_g1_i2:279-1994(-)